MTIPYLLLGLVFAAASPSPGPEVGETLPSFSLLDQAGKARDLASLAGPRGLVLVMYRSADW